ncbi:MAG: hypothetical protein NTW19_20360 [Planctomycetota bacterium]|nr:hypothetical protein [Planctomycetota bacterium]
MLPTLPGPTLAELVSQSQIDWLTKDPSGQKVGLLIAVVAVLVVLIVAVKMMKWAAARASIFIGLAILGAGVYYGSFLIFNLGAVGLAVAGFAVFGMVLGGALFLTHGK